MPGDEETIDFANEHLISALASLADQDTPERRAALYSVLAGSNVILPAPEDGLADEATDLSGEGDVLANEGTMSEDIPLLIFENDAGEPMLMAFSDEDAALTWDPDRTAFVALRGLDLLLIAVQQGIGEIALNPGSATSVRLPRREFEAVALDPSRAAHPHAIEGARPPARAGTTVLVAPPDEQPPEAWQESVREVLTSYPSVDSAYFFQLHGVSEGPRPVIGVALYEGMHLEAQERLMNALLAEIEAMLPQGWTLDFIVLDDPGFLTMVADTVAPLYKRDEVR